MRSLRVACSNHYNSNRTNLILDMHGFYLPTTVGPGGPTSGSPSLNGFSTFLFISFLLPPPSYAPSSLLGKGPSCEVERPTSLVWYTRYGHQRSQLMVCHGLAESPLPLPVNSCLDLAGLSEQGQVSSPVNAGRRWRSYRRRASKRAAIQTCEHLASCDGYHSVRAKQRASSVRS